MDAVYFDPIHQLIQTVSLAEASQRKDGLIWVDIYPSDEAWEAEIEVAFQLNLDEQHSRDANNPLHPPFFDNTDDYDMLVYRALTHTALQAGNFQVETAPIVFFMRECLLITRHSTTQTSFQLLRERWLKQGRLKAPLSTMDIASRLLSWLTDQYLALRAPFGQQMHHWQHQLLDNNNVFRDWPALVNASTQLRNYRLNIIEPQEEALDEWIDESELVVESRVMARLSDILEHFSRVNRDATALQSDLENLVQIYFSATNQRTNEIIRVLTIASVIFLPLNLLAGIYGMNFEWMPGLRNTAGFWIMLGAMSTIVISILVVLRLKRWL
ncbi:magnesium transporter CorA family protein [Thiolinea disciformis]|uniref:magnesium transporter CorA family protein n=1 Tax=Thiolinea disciformis TaxID=125614 RepID=UPI000366F994|nr:magnesium transporter CorA family protein [Thiolinea disciformis]